MSESTLAESGVSLELTHRARMVVMVGVMSGMLLSALDATIINTALKTITDDLGGLSKYAWVGTAYLLTSTISTPMFGKLSDLLGRRVMYYVAIISFVIGSVLCSLAQTMEFLVVARALQGIGGGGLNSMAFIVVGDVIPPRERGRYTGYLTSLWAGTSVIGPLIGGLIIDNASWRWIFWVNVPVGIFALIMISATLKMPFVKVKRSIDYLGTFLLTGSVTTLILMLSWSGEQYGWGSTQTVLLGVCTFILGALFAWWETVAEEPLVPPRLIKIAVIRVVVPSLLVFGIIMFGVSAFVPLFLQAVTGVSPTISGMLMLPQIFGVMFASLYTGRQIAKTGKYKAWMMAGATAMTIGVTGLSLLDQTNTGLSIGIIALFIMGMGTGTIGPTTTIVVQNAVDHQDLGIATSMISFFRSLGGSIGLAAFGALFNHFSTGKVKVDYLNDPRLVKKLAEPEHTQVLSALSDSITSLFRIAIPIIATLIVLVLMIKEHPLRETTAPQHAVME